MSRSKGQSLNQSAKWPLLAIFLTVFIDMLSFGMAIPDLQVRAEKLGAHGIVIGLLLASYSIAQLFTAPLLGRWSDVVGRRKVLLITCSMTFICFVIYSQAQSLPVMFASRILAGISAANIGVAFAYIADITKPEERASGMGMIGAAFGLGFIFGPVFGAQLVDWGGGGPQLLGFVSAGLALINVAFVWRYLPEPDALRAKASASLKENFSQLVRALRTPGLGLLVMLFFVANFAFSNLESTFFRLLEWRFQMGQKEGALVLFVVGVVAAFMQGYAIGKLTKRFGEVALMRVGYALMTPCLALVPFSPPWVSMLIVAALIGVASGLYGPSVQSLISRSAPIDMQGGVSGIIQSAGALARIFGPLCGSVLFDINTAMPYFAAAGLMLIPTMLSFFYKRPADGGQESEGYALGH